LIFARRNLIICILFAAATIILPYGYAVAMGLGSPDLIIAGLFWEYIESFYFTGFRLLNPSFALATVPFWFFRLVFLSQFILYYEEGKSRTRVRIIAFGILSELIPILVSLPGLLNLAGWTFPLYSYVIPIPVLLLLGVIVLFVFPKRMQEELWEERAAT
jgi:hypothetical protein